MRRTLGISLALSAVLILGGAPAVHGVPVPWAGTCALIVTFEFATPVWGAGLDSVSAPSYSISVTPAADLDPRTEGVVEPCAVAPGGFNPFRTTSVTASGSALVWTCEAALATGGWIQGWSPAPAPDPVSGSHLITGGPDVYMLKIQNPSLTSAGTMELVVHPDDASKPAQCETSSITSLKTVGVLEVAQR